MNSVNVSISCINITDRRLYLNIRNVKCTAISMLVMPSFPAVFLLIFTITYLILHKYKNYQNSRASY